MKSLILYPTNNWRSWVINEINKGGNNVINGSPMLIKLVCAKVKFASWFLVIKKYSDFKLFLNVIPIIGKL